MARNLTAVAFALLLATVALTGTVAARDCIDNATVQVRIASQMFEVPLTYYPFISDLDREGLRPKNCPGEPKEQLVQPIEAVGLHIITDHQFVTQDQNTQAVFGVRIELFPSSVPNPVSHNRLKRIEAQILESGRQLEDLPHVGQFYGFAEDESYPENFIYYIALPDGPQTPDGYPVTYWCQPPSSLEVPEDASSQTVTAVEKMRELGRLCLVRYSWSNELTLAYRFRTGRYPVQTWDQLDSEVRAFVKNLMVDG